MSGPALKARFQKTLRLTVGTHVDIKQAKLDRFIRDAIRDARKRISLESPLRDVDVVKVELMETTPL